MQNGFVETFILESLVYIPVGEHQAVMLRPYVVNSSEQAVEKIVDRMHEAKTVDVSVNVLNGVANQILEHSGVAYNSAINQNWISTKRYIFMLKVRVIEAWGGETCYYLQGYTEYDGLTPQVTTCSADMDMLHHVNNVIETGVMAIPTPFGEVRREKISKIYNIVNNNITDYSNDLYTMRPVDIMDTGKMLEMTTVMGGGSNNVSGFNANSTLTQFDRRSIASMSDNALSTSYLSRVLNTGVQMATENSLFMDSWGGVANSETAAILNEPSMADNRFLRHISMIAGFQTVMSTFSMGSLTKIDPSIYQRFVLNNITKDFTNPAMNNTPTVGDYWTGQDPVTIKAYSLIENAVAMASRYGFSKMNFIATNTADMMGTPSVFVSYFNSYMSLDDSDILRLVELFKVKFLQEVFLNETEFGRIPTHAEVFFDLLGTTKIMLCYAGYPSNWYTIPTFANSGFTSIAGLDRNVVDYTAIQLNTIAQQIAQQIPATQHTGIY